MLHATKPSAARCTPVLAFPKRQIQALCAAKNPLDKKHSTTELLAMEKKASANNYSPLPVVFEKAKSMMVQDPEGKIYYDFLAGYGAVSQGHCHPRLLAAATKAMKTVSLSSRAFHSAAFGVYADFITKFFGYENVLPMNTGAEAVETGMKLARKWGYKSKGIAPNKAKIVCCTGNFHGRTFGAITLSEDADSRANYGPLLPGILRVEYGNAAALEKLFKDQGKTICGFICEPIQGEAGVVIPPKGYLREVRRLCTKYNVMYISDEVQSGMGRSGKLLAADHEGVRPDAVLLAKALGGGLYPVAAVLADRKFMQVIEPGTHGSTFGGNPVACAVGIEAMRVLVDEGLIENSRALGDVLGKFLNQMKKDYPIIREVRCRGLFAAIEFDHKILDGLAAKKFMYLMAKRGVLTKTTHGHTVRLSPPLTLTAKQLKDVMGRLHMGVKEIAALVGTVDKKAVKPAAKAVAKKSTKKAAKKSSKKKVTKKAKKSAKKTVRRVKKAASKVRKTIRKVAKRKAAKKSSGKKAKKTAKK